MDFGLQLSVKLGDDMLNIRGENEHEFAANLEAAKRGLSHIKEFLEAFKNSPATAAQALQTLSQAGLNPQVIQPEIAPQAQPQGFQGPPQPQWGQPVPGHPGAIPVGAVPVQVQQAPTGAACIACNKVPSCKVCGGPTHLTVVGKDKKYNAHQCNQGCDKGAVWCKTPIASALAPSLGNAQLVYG